MSLSMVVQAFGWVAVVWLIAVHLLIRQGRLHRGGAAPRVAGAAAALVIVVASLLAGMWPVFVLGLLWLRSELWHRHSPEEAWFPLPDEPPHPDLPEAEVTHPPTQAGRASGGGTATRTDTAVRTQTAARTESTARTETTAQPRVQSRARARARVPAARSEPGAPERHRHPLLTRRVVDVLFRVEMTLLIAVTVAAFGFWAYQEQPGFARRADTSLCSIMGGCK